MPSPSPPRHSSQLVPHCSHPIPSIPASIFPPSLLLFSSSGSALIHWPGRCVMCVFWEPLFVSPWITSSNIARTHSPTSVVEQNRLLIAIHFKCQEANTHIKGMAKERGCIWHVRIYKRYIGSSSDPTKVRLNRSKRMCWGHKEGIGYLPFFTYSMNTWPDSIPTPFHPLKDPYWCTLLACPCRTDSHLRCLPLGHPGNYQAAEHQLPTNPAPGEPGLSLVLGQR